MESRGGGTLALRRAADEAVDRTAPAGADMRVSVRRQILQHHARRHDDPAAFDQRMPETVVADIGARATAVALNAIGAAIAAGGTRARLPQALVPVVIFGMPLAVM